MTARTDHVSKKDHRYDSLTSEANLKAVCAFLNPLDGFDSRNGPDILDSFLRMDELGCTASDPGEVASGSLASLIISLCSIMCS